MCQKEIIYMNLLKNEVKTACVGFLKYQKKNGQFQVDIQVKNAAVEMSGSFPIRIQTEAGWQETGMLTLSQGYGEWRGILPEEVIRAEIMLSDMYKVKGESKNAVKLKSEGIAEDKGRAEKASEKRAEKVSEEKVEKASEKKAEKAAEKKAEKTVEEKAEKEVEKKKTIENTIAGRGAENDAEENKQTNKQIIGSTANNTETQRTVAETIMRAESMPMTQRRISGPRLAVKKEHTPLYENKWEQLLATYEQIHPYADNRIYVKLEPKDFIVLRENYQHLVNNSFLLHGFYNYRYLILGKEQDFYLGVPGVFYEREKMVALMFGFEAFECEGGEAEEGKFGYYLRKVEL